MAHIERDGTKLFYMDIGSGRPPLLFVHGFCGEHAQFAPQLEHFAAKHRVVALDRRGHGQSDKPEQDYTVGLFADDIAWTCRELGLHRPVMVVHSMGAIGLEVNARYPDLLGGLVVLDAPVRPPEPMRAAFAAALEGMRSPAWRDVVRGFADQVAFRPGDQSALKARIVERMLATPQHVVVSSWANFLAYDPEPAARKLRLPLLFVNATMPVDEANLRATAPQVQFEKIEGTGHFCHLEAPERVNAAIERFVGQLPSVERAA